MRICTYNVLALRGFPVDEAAQQLGERESPERIEHFVRVFQELNCDVLALQEGGVPAPMIQEIARRMGMYLATIPSPCNWPGQLLSRYPIRQSRVYSHLIPDVPTPALSRCAGAVCIQPDGAGEFWVVVIHLHPSDHEMRLRESALLDAFIGELCAEGNDVVVLGDFNCAVDEEIHQRLERRRFVNAMTAVGGGLSPTIDTVGKKLRTIDHIYVSASLSDKLRSAYVVRSPGFRHDGPQEAGVWVHSDHLPVVAELDL